MLKKQKAKKAIRLHDSFNQPYNIFEVPKRLKYGMEMLLQCLVSGNASAKMVVVTLHEDAAQTHVSLFCSGLA